MIRQFAIFLAAGVLMLAPFSASAATVNFFGPIVDERCNCVAGTAENPSQIPSAPDWACVLLTIQNAIAVGITFIVIMITLVIAYSGIMIIAQPTNAGHREQARQMVTNAVLGLILVLTAWLIVDFVMKAFYNPDAAAEYTKGKALPWNQIISDDATSEDLCFEPKGTLGDGSTTGPGTVTPTTPTTPTAPAPAADSTNGEATIRPRGVSVFAATASGSTINLSWGKVTDTTADWYVLKRSTAGGAYQSIKNIPLSQDTYQDTALAAGTKYSYQLMTWNEAGFSPGAVAEATTEGVPVGPGTGGTNSKWPATYSATQISTRATNSMKYESQLCAAARANGLSGASIKYVFGVLGVESNGNATAGSSAGAIGLMQLLPDTARQLDSSLGSLSDSQVVAKLKDPSFNINLGVKYFARMMSLKKDLTQAAAAYNAGPGSGVNSNGTKQAFAPSVNCPGLFAWECKTNSGGFAETQKYVGNVAAVAASVGTVCD